MKRLIQLSDCHLFSDPKREAYGVNPADTLRDVISQVKTDNPDLVLVTGDISGDDGAQSYQLFAELLDAQLDAIPWFVIPGNHDVNTSFDTILGHRQLQPGEPVRLGNWQIHGLDTRHKGTLGHVSAAAMKAVSQAISATEGNHHLLTLHHHIRPSQSWMDKHCLINAGEVETWIADQTGLHVVLHGHIHSSSKYAIGDSTILGVPSTCWQWAMQPEFGTANTVPGYRELSLSDDGSWTTLIRRLQ